MSASGSDPAHSETPLLILTETPGLHDAEHRHRDDGGGPSPERGRRARQAFGHPTPLCYTCLPARGRAGALSSTVGRARPIRSRDPSAHRETPMDDAQPPEALLSQSLAVLRHCIPTLETAAAQAPTVAAALQDTVTALRGVDRALHEHRDTLRRAHHFATLGRLAAGLTHEIRNPLGALFLHIDLLEEEYRDPSPESPTLIPQTFSEIRTALTRLDELVQDYLLVRVSTIEMTVQDMGATVQAWVAELEAARRSRG